jgi:signal peptidase II
MKPRIGVFLSVLIFFIATASDLVTKYSFFKTSESASHGLFSFLLQKTAHRNYGMSFDIAVPPVILIGLNLFILGSLFIFLILQWKRQAWGKALALSLLLGGAVGNLFDRLTFGYVRDWLLLFETSAINLADVFILAGAITYLALHQSTAHPPTKKLYPPLDLP